MDTHPVVAVLDSAEIEVRRGSEKPAVELAEDVEDVLSEVLVLVDRFVEFDKKCSLDDSVIPFSFPWKIQLVSNGIDEQNKKDMYK